MDRLADYSKNPWDRRLVSLGILLLFFACFAATFLFVYWDRYTTVTIVNESSLPVFIQPREIQAAGYTLIRVEPGESRQLKKAFTFSDLKGFHVESPVTQSLRNFTSLAPDSAWKIQKHKNRSTAINKIEGIHVSNRSPLFFVNDFTEDAKIPRTFGGFSLSLSAAKDEPPPTIESSLRNRHYCLASALPFSISLLLPNATDQEEWHRVESPQFLDGKIPEPEPDSETPLNDLLIPILFNDEDLMAELHGKQAKDNSQQVIIDTISADLNTGIKGDSVHIALKPTAIFPDHCLYTAIIESDDFPEIKKAKTPKSKVLAAKKKQKNLKSTESLHLVNLTPFHMNVIVLSDLNRRETRVEWLSLEPGTHRKFTNSFLATPANFSLVSISSIKDRPLVETLFAQEDFDFLISNDGQVPGDQLIHKLREGLGSPSNRALGKTIPQSDLIENMTLEDVTTFKDVAQNSDGSFTSVFRCADTIETSFFERATEVGVPAKTLASMAQSALDLRRAIDMRRRFRAFWSQYHHLPMFFGGDLDEADDENSRGIRIGVVDPRLFPQNDPPQVGDILVQVAGEPIFGREELLYVINQWAFLKGVFKPLEYVILRDGVPRKGQMLWRYNPDHWVGTYGEKESMVGRSAATLIGLGSGVTLGLSDTILEVIANGYDPDTKLGNRVFWDAHFVEANRQLFPGAMTSTVWIQGMFQQLRFVVKSMPKFIKTMANTQIGNVAIDLAEHAIWLQLSLSPLQDDISSDFANDSIFIGGISFVTGTLTKSKSK